MATHPMLLLLLSLTATAAAIDYRTGHIPNRLVLAGLGAGLALQLVLALWSAPSATRLSWLAINVALGAACCALVPLLLYRLNALGGGDVKLLAALGAVLGPAAGLQLMFYAFVAAALYAPAKLLYQGRLLLVMANSGVVLRNAFVPPAKRRAIPEHALTSIRFGPAIFAGACFLSYVRWWS